MRFQLVTKTFISKGDLMHRTLRLLALGAIVVAIAALTGCGTLSSAVGSIISGGSVAWSADAQQWKGNINRVYSVTLPPMGEPGQVWGTDVYTDDSSIGTAAVHQGLITFASGGTVKIRILPGRASYTGSTRSGVASDGYDEWDGSFEFVTY